MKAMQHVKETNRAVTPNPFYHHQKRKLLLKFQKQLLEQSIVEQQNIQIEQ
jgi:hypothetical protein